MHVGFDAKRFFQNATGLGNYARTTVLGLAEHYPEHRYTLFTARAQGPFCTLAAKSGLFLQEACPAGQTFPTLWRSLGIPWTARHTGIDIFHGLSHELPLIDFPHRVRTVVSMHDLLFLTHPQLYPWVDRQLYTFKYRKSCRRADLIVAISRKTADDVEELFGIPRDRIRVVYQSCSPVFSSLLSKEALEKIRTRLRLPSEFLLFVGSLIARKGVQTLLSALAAIPHADRPHVVLVGAGPLGSRLREQVASLKMVGQIHFLGQVQADDLPGLYQMAQAFVYPSVGEGFGIPILEALSSGIPVITSRGSCFAEPGGDAALYTVPGDVEELAQTVRKVWTDPGLRAGMIARGYEHVRKFHPARTASNLMDVYTELAPGRLDA